MQYNKRGLYMSNISNILDKYQKVKSMTEKERKDYFDSIPNSELSFEVFSFIENRIGMIDGEMFCKICSYLTHTIEIMILSPDLRLEIRPTNSSIFFLDIPAA